MRALCWAGDGHLAVRQVPDPELRNDQDAIVRVRCSATSGADLPLLAGGSPTFAVGDVLGHEFVGDVVEVGRRVHRHRVGDRVVVAATVSCGACWYCRRGLPAACDNGSVGPTVDDPAWGESVAGCFGRPPAGGGLPGGHAEYVRVPYADVGAFGVPEPVPDDRALFASAAAPAGWLGAELGGVGPGDVVAVWGAGAVGQLAARAARLLGADRVVVVDRHPDRLRFARWYAEADTLDHANADVLAELRELSGGRGPDVCVEAVGADGGPPRSRAERFLGAGRPPDAVREAVYACRKGGTVVVLGDRTDFADAFPLGVLTRRGVTLHGSRPQAHRHIPMLLGRMARDELRTEHLATHHLPLDRAADGYALFRDRADGCLRAVFSPG
ncbi:Threonine dehydrogenase [Micromonospora nigra]|uniref:Threonine dehydrogenase n=1 Tax=Micromonospora nigra TaxID=145857 RepID=A0A1C6RII2_9ACTN|nr:alcohol dehydrogenase catalytic domain-containing protein [Micromonospora nigra]SCL16950.1 Threonine dehydrogenase [Micromonospora nigra]